MSSRMLMYFEKDLPVNSHVTSFIVLTETETLLRVICQKLPKFLQNLKL